MRVVALTVFLMYTSLTAIGPLIAPLSRELTVPEWQIGLVVSTAALCITLAGPTWGRLSQKTGPKRVLAITLISGAVSMAAFAAAAQAGITGTLTATSVFVLMLLTRGIWFGLAEAAVLPTAQAYVASLTPDSQQRVRGMAAIGAASGASMIAGPVLGGLLGGLSLLAPLWAVPLILLVALAVVTTTLPARPHHESVTPQRVRPADRRIWPYLVVSFGLYTALGFLQILIGFLIQDRLTLNAQATTLATGAALLCAGVGLVLSQTVLIRVLTWKPAGYIRAGAVTTTLGFALLTPDWGIASILAGIFTVGVGMGLAAPGITGGASLSVEPDEQGSIAGLLAATNAITFILTPIAATSLYTAATHLPLTIALLISITVAVFGTLHPSLRHTTPPAPADPDHP